MKLFTNDNNFKEINEKPFKLEKDIQSITEKNINKIFGLKFIKSEYFLKNLRIDSLCFDEKNSSFVIIEYKNTKNFSVIDQGYSYLSLMLNNKAEFVIKKSKIKVYINLKYQEIDDYKNRVRDVTNIGSWGNGDCEFTYKSIEDMDYLLSLIKQSFKKNG